MKTTLFCFFCLTITGALAAQAVGGHIHKASRELFVRWEDGVLYPGSGPDSGPSLWNNTGLSAFWPSPTTGYLCLDWGKLPAPVSGLEDHVIDGFTFFYGTNNCNLEPNLLADITITFFDDCTGWGNKGIQESAFTFTGLPTVYSSPQLGWIFSVTTDLEGSGYEFLSNGDFGIGFTRLSTPQITGYGPAVGLPPNVLYNGPTGTEDAFDDYRPNGTLNGTWNFGGYPFWATWPAALFGTEGAANMTFYGVGASGNDAALYATGAFAAGDTVHFMLRKNRLPLGGYLLASRNAGNHYFSGPYDITKLVGSLAPGFPLVMNDSPLGDYCVLDVPVPVHYGGAAVYFQGLLDTPPLIQPPVNGSNGLKAN